jgi:Tol biopolymer transport system component
MHARVITNPLARVFGLSVFVLISGSGHTALPMQAERMLEFETNEGTWMSVDVSPDGETLIFDLLGDLYQLPASGGAAERITGGMAFDSQPVYSPDGDSIAFISDRSGAENLWVANSDGSGLRQITGNDGVRLYLAPTWSADGSKIYHSVFRADLAAYELWAVGLDGELSLLSPVKTESSESRDDWISAVGVTASQDGKWLYFSRLVGQADVDVPPWTIQRLDLERGTVEPVVEPIDSRAGKRAQYSYFQPLISPDGLTLVYSSRHRGQTGLRVRDLQSGHDQWLAWPVQRDQANFFHVQGIMPGMAFMPDGRSVLLTRENKLFRLFIEDGRFEEIHFKADVSLGLGPIQEVLVPEDTGPVKARVIQAPALSPNSEHLVFSALGQILVSDLRSDDPPSELVDLPGGQFQPSWSPDGLAVTFITWTASDGGHVWVAPVNGSSDPRRITADADYYSNPAFTGDGKQVLALRSRHQDRMAQYMEYGELRDASLISIPLDGGEPDELIRGQLGGALHFSNQTGTVFVASSDGLNAVDLETGEKSLVASAQGYGWYFVEGPGAISALKISPDGQWLLARDAAQQLYLFPVPDSPHEVTDLRDPNGPHIQLSEIGADYFGWNPDRTGVYWAIGSTLFRCRLDLPSASENLTKGCNALVRTEIQAEFSRDTPRGYLVLRGATVLTMKGNRVIESADVHIEDNRIAAVVHEGELALPDKARIVPVDGKFIVPGFIDAHHHIADIRREVLDLQSWGPAANLAWGITTSFDPSSLTIDMFAYQDLVDSGRMIGTRIRTTGPAIFSFHNFREPEEIESVLLRYRDYYRTRNLKMYRSGNREIRQWFAMVSARLGMRPTTEGALAMKLGLTQVIDGYAGLEHELAAVPLGKDVIELMAQSGVAYTPTLNISAGPDAKDYFIARDDPATDPKVNRFFPGYAIDSRLRGTDWRTYADLNYPAAAEEAGRIISAGGLVAAGSHGDIPGLGLHWEMRALASGGLEPMDVLRSATLQSARAIGKESDFGSIEPGKIADLVVLDSDPRLDISNTLSIKLVMKNGRLYQADTLNEIWPRESAFPTPWFQGNQRADDVTATSAGKR